MAVLNPAALMPVSVSSTPLGEPHVNDHVGQMTEAAYAAPSLLGAHGKLMHDTQRRLLTQTIPGPRRSQPYGGEGRLEKAQSLKRWETWHVSSPKNPSQRIGRNHFPFSFPHCLLAFTRDIEVNI